MIGAAWQQQIYQAGMLGERPALPLSPDELERQAKEVLSPEAFGYVAGGAGSEDTIRENREALRRWRIVPRMLQNVQARTMQIELFGQRFPAPLLLAPVGVQSIVHPDGELASARAASELGVPYVHSTAASFSIEEAAVACGDGPRWFQLYWSANPDLNASFLERAERAGYSAIVVTLDTPLLAWRERDLERAYLPFLQAVGIANYLTDPVFRAAAGNPPEEEPLAAVPYFLSIFSSTAHTWTDLAHLREHTKLPILLKGILGAEQAKQALDHGMQGVIVSNHGGRQVDGAIGAVQALPSVVDAIAGEAIVLFDSGIRRAADAFKAIALGAKAVLLGRPYVYGLALAGEAGVRNVLLNFLADLDLTLGLTGHNSFADVSRADLVEAGRS